MKVSETKVKQQQLMRLHMVTLFVSVIMVALLGSVAVLLSVDNRY